MQKDRKSYIFKGLKETRFQGDIWGGRRTVLDIESQEGSVGGYEDEVGVVFEWLFFTRQG